MVWPLASSFSYQAKNQKARDVIALNNRIRNAQASDWFARHLDKTLEENRGCGWPG